MFIGLTILSLVAAVICGTAWRIWEQRDDPLAPELLQLGQNPQAAVEYFAPDGQLDSNGHWMPGPSSQARWEHLRSRTWRASGYDALTSAVEAASSLRANETGDTTNERAAWATGRGISLLATRETDYSTPAKQHIGTILANSIREMRETAASGSLMDSRGDLSGNLVTPYDENAPTPITENIAEEIIQLTKIAGSDDSALHTMVEEVRRTSQSNTRVVLESEPGAVVSDSATLDKMLYISLKDDGQVLGLIYESAIIARTGQTSAAIRTASPSGSDPKFDAINDEYTSAKNTLFQSVITQIASYRSLPEDVYTDSNGRDYSSIYDWITPDHTIDLNLLRGSAEAQQQWDQWIEDSSFPSKELVTPFTQGNEDGAAVVD